MKTVVRTLLFALILGVFFMEGAREVKAAASPIDFALPTESKRGVYSLALIRRDNTAKLIPVDGVVKRAVVSPGGAKLAYVTRSEDRLQIFVCDPDGKNKKLVEDYKSEQRNFQDFVDIRFVKNGSILLIARYLKNELSFIEYNMKMGKPRFVNKIEWQGAPSTVFRFDPYKNGTFVFLRINNQGNKMVQQVWTAGAYEGKFSLFMEIEAPPSILDIVPDVKNKRIFASGTLTKRLSAKSSVKNLLLIDNIRKEPKNLTNDPLFLNMMMSDDGNSIVWQSSNYAGGLKFKRYKVQTGEVVEIALEGQKAQGDTGQPGTIVPTTNKPAQPSKNK